MVQTGGRVYGSERNVASTSADTAARKFCRPVREWAADPDCVTTGTDVEDDVLCSSDAMTVVEKAVNT